MIETIKVARYVAVCDSCGRRFSPSSRPSMAEAELRGHRCGEHRRQYDSTGGYRGILGGWNVYCVCGASYVTEDPTEPFACPKDEAGRGDE